MNKELIFSIVYILLAILILVVLHIKIKDCHNKGGKFVRGYCISNEVIK